MRGRKELTIEEALRQTHYQNILFLIEQAQIQKKKITFEHLKYVLVKNAMKKLYDKEKEDLYDFFKYPDAEVWSGDNGKPRNVESSVEFMIFIDNMLSEETQISSVNNLSNFLKRLIDLRLIEKKGRKRNRKYYVVTNKCILYRRRYIITEQVEIFLDYVFNNRRPLNESLFMLNEFLSDIETSYLRLVSGK